MYRFFQRWCPNIHNAMDEDESTDDEMTAPSSYSADEEVGALTKYIFNYS